MSNINYKVEGLDKAMLTIAGLVKPDVLSGAIRAGAAHIKGKVSTYPPATEANSPARKRWYERGYGPKWARKDGSIGGRKSSEMLGRRWATQLADNGLTGIIGNNVSYAPFVHDPQKQAAFHANRGWKTTDQVAKEERATVIKFIEQAIQRALR